MPHISYTTLFCSKKLTITAVTSWFLFKNFNYREGLKLKLKKNKIILMLNCFLDDWQNFENLRNIFIKKILKNKITININNIKIINYLINLGYFNKTFIDQIKKLIRISVNKLSSVEDKLFKILPEIRKIIIELNSILIANLIISEDKKNKLFGIYIIFYNILKIVGLNDIMLEMVIKDLDNKKINFKKNINELGYCTHKNIFKLKKMNLYLKLNIFVRTIMLLMLKLLKMLNFMYVIDILNLKKKLIASFVNIDSNSTFNFYFKNTKYNLNFLLKLINSYNNKKIIVFNSIKTKKHIRIKKLVIFFLKNKNIYNLKIKRGDKQKINQKYNMTFIFKKNKIIFLKKNNKFGILLSLKKKNIPIRYVVGYLTMKNNKLKENLERNKQIYFKINRRLESSIIAEVKNLKNIRNLNLYKVLYNLTLNFKSAIAILKLFFSLKNKSGNIKYRNDLSDRTFLFINSFYGTIGKHINILSIRKKPNFIKFKKIKFNFWKMFNMVSELFIFARYFMWPIFAFLQKTYIQKKN